MEAGGRFVFVEYDQRTASQWVPHPISVEWLHDLALEAGLGAPVVVGSRPSEYSGRLYAAYADVAAERHAAPH
jgi:hypothetical protein